MERGFVGKVLEHVPRATAEEKRSIRRELEDHLEDHTAALEEMGHGPEEARRRAEEAMGDPAEIGRALNGQLSAAWLWLGRVCRALGFLLLGMAVAVGAERYDSSARWFRERVREDPTELVRQYTTEDPAGGLKEQGYRSAWSVDIRLEVGEDVIYIYEVRIDPTPGWYRAAVRGLVYNRDPAWPAADLLGEAELTSQWGNGGKEMGGAMRYSVKGITGRDFAGVPVSPEDDHLLLSGEHFGQTWSMEIPLDWKEVGL